MSHPLLTIARRTLAGQLGEKPSASQPPGGEGTPPRGCFVSLKARGRLRGCMGTLFPTQPTLEQEVAANALAAALRDPRFEPVTSQELAGLHISVDVLSPLQAVDSPAQLDPARYGLVVRAGKKAGVLLPSLPGVSDGARQIEICREKAGISPHEPVNLERFTVERFEE